MNATTNDTPRVYAACLASYNNGILHGEWIDATDADILREGIQEMLSKSPVPGAEEWAFHDYDNFGGMTIGEYEDIDKLCELGAMIEEHGAAFAAYADHVGASFATADGFEEAYCGEWDSEEAYAEELFDELYLCDVPEHVQNYIDYEAFARDLFMGDNYSVDNPEGGLFVFRSN